MRDGGCGARGHCNIPKERGSLPWATAFSTLLLERWITSLGEFDDPLDDLQDTQEKEEVVNVFEDFSLTIKPGEKVGSTSIYLSSVPSLTPSIFLPPHLQLPSAVPVTSSPWNQWGGILLQSGDRICALSSSLLHPVVMTFCTWQCLG